MAALSLCFRLRLGLSSPDGLLPVLSLLAPKIVVWSGAYFCPDGTDYWEVWFDSLGAVERLSVASSFPLLVHIQFDNTQGRDKKNLDTLFLAELFA